MKKFTLLIDADDTILDFGICERKAINLVIEQYELHDCIDFADNFKKVNHELWQQYELCKITSNDIVWKRFEILFAMYSINGLNPKKVGESYKHFLESQYDLIDGAVNALTYFQKSHELHCITNGTTQAQTQRFKFADLNKFFKNVFISEVVGYRKPQKDFFDFVLANISETNKCNIYVIGDSLTADISGGNAFGLNTIWFNRFNIKNNTSVIPTYQVNSFDSLQILIDSLSK